MALLRKLILISAEIDITKNSQHLLVAIVQYCYIAKMPHDSAFCPLLVLSSVLVIALLQIIQILLCLPRL